MNWLDEIAAAVGFLTRFRVGARGMTGAKMVAKSSRWFPLVGALLGAVYCDAFALLSRVFPALVTAVLIVATDAWLTGAMHLDGLADTADGFGGGWTREDVLRIMRDHAIGAYGAVAIALAVALKITAIAAFPDRAAAMCALALAPVWGRWSAVFGGATQPYARAEEDREGTGAAARFIGRAELAIATVMAGLISAGIMIATSLRIAGSSSSGLIVASAGITIPWRSIAAIVIAWIIAFTWGRWSKRRTGGITGDTLGAGVEIVECAMLLCFAARHPL